LGFSATGSCGEFTFLNDSENTAGGVFYAQSDNQSNIGFEKRDTITMYFIIDDSGYSSFIINIGGLLAAKSGQLRMTITSQGLAGNTGVSTQVRDGESEFGIWDVNTGSISSAKWGWDRKNTDGGVIGFMPAEGYCMTFVFTELSGIDTIRIGSFDAAENIMRFKTLPAQEGFGGIEFCANSYSPTTSPLPTSNLPSIPPSLTATCKDTPFDFSYEKNWVNCAWVQSNDQCFRGKFSKMCPATCNTCLTCVDGKQKMRFYIPLEDRWTDKKCKHIARDKNLCNIEGVTDSCRETCGVC